MDFEFIGLFEKGGLLIWPILLCSLIGTTIFFERRRRFLRVMSYLGVCKRTISLVGNGKTDEARENLTTQEQTSPCNRILLEALNLNEPDRDTLEMVLVHSVDREMTSLSRYMDTLAVLGSTSPLLGLLGTVVGMIKAFIVVEKMGGGVNASILAGGIWEAMLTTAFGLLVAIPLLFSHNHLDNKLHLIQAELEDLAITYLKVWSLIQKKVH